MGQCCVTHTTYCQTLTRNVSINCDSIRAQPDSIHYITLSLHCETIAAAVVLLTTVTLFLLAHLFQTWLAYNLFKIHLLRLLPKLPVCHRINFKIATITFKVLMSLTKNTILSRCPNSTVCADTITTIVFFLVNMCSYLKNCNGKVQIILTRCFHIHWNNLKLIF